MTEKERKILTNCFLFQGMEDKVKKLAGELLPPTLFQKGERIYDSEHFQKALGILLSGEAQVSRTGADGRRTVMNRLTAGQIFGVAALFGKGEEYVTDVEAVGRVKVLFIPQEKMLLWIRQEPCLAENYIRFLSDRVRFLNGRIASLTAGQSNDRLREYLLEYSREDGTVELPHSMVELAQRLHIGRSSLYRSLEGLEAEGFLRREGHQIFLQVNQRLNAD